MAAIAAAAMGAGVAQAYTVGTFSNGFVVPNVVHNGAADTTAVGLVNYGPNPVPVYWTFFNPNSGHVTDGCFNMTAKQYSAFVWSDKSGRGLEGQRGYLVFAQGTGSACGAVGTLAAAGSGTLTGAAFQVDSANQDVAVIPVIDGDLSVVANTDLTRMDENSLTSVAGGLQVTTAATSPTMALRYGIDGKVNSGVDTRIAVWSTGSHKGTNTVNIYNDKQERKSVNFTLNNTEQDWFDPETIAGLPADYTDGFIEWQPKLKDASGVATTGTAFGYSVIYAPAFGAVQSILGAHTK